MTRVASESPTYVHTIDEVHEHFNRCDKNQDGKLAKDECPFHWEGGYGPTFDEVDKDGNGEVSWEEMKDAAKATSIALESEFATEDRYELATEDRNGKSKVHQID